MRGREEEWGGRGWDRGRSRGKGGGGRGREGMGFFRSRILPSFSPFHAPPSFAFFYSSLELYVYLDIYLFLSPNYSIFFYSLFSPFHFLPFSSFSLLQSRFSLILLPFTTSNLFVSSSIPSSLLHLQFHIINSFCFFFLYLSPPFPLFTFPLPLSLSFIILFQQ